MLTPLYWVSNLAALMVFYFINQWMPTVLSHSGVSIEQAAIATTLFQFGGTLGGLVSMRVLDRYGFLPVPILFACAIPIVIAIGVPGLPPLALIGLVASAGFCLLGLQFGNIATEANIYPTYIRSWGIASNFAIARIGGALGPLLGGMAFGARLPAQQIFAIAAAPLVVGLIVALFIVPRYRAQIAAPARRRRGRSARATERRIGFSGVLTQLALPAPPMLQIDAYSAASSGAIRRSNRVWYSMAPFRPAASRLLLPQDIARGVVADEGAGARNLETARMGAEIDAGGPFAVG